MQTEIRLTSEITNLEWECYSTAFNQVFEKDFTINYFKHKYFNTVDSHSYHVFLESEDGIAGAITVIPFEYLFDNEIKRVGLAVDVFILPDYRTDPLALFKMYKVLKDQLIQREIVMVIAVPNDMAYPYWKNVVKWNDIGLLTYHALPVKFGSAKTKFLYLLNPLRFCYTWLMIFISYFAFSTEKQSRIKINRNKKVIEKQRYNNKEHIKHNTKKYFFSYRIQNEDSVNTCFLIDFYNKKKAAKDTASLAKAIKRIILFEKVEIIVFIGRLSFFQLLLIKVPLKLEPKHLYLTADILIPDSIDKELVFNINNWDFGLFNYDVR
ncbi:MAG: hypothetical protein NTZ33_12340 [Bacteroidetes bacterium]|nr:hypothetical protein [Bacteroidota bacterium]